MLKVINLTKYYNFAHIEYMPELNRDKPYYLIVQPQRKRFSTDTSWYKTEGAAKAYFTKGFQNPKWGIDYPKPIWERK